MENKKIVVTNKVKSFLFKGFSFHYLLDIFLIGKMIDLHTLI